MNMRLLVVAVCIALMMLPSSCSRKDRPDAIDHPVNGLVTENDTSIRNGEDSITDGQSLNDIRFARFKDRDWIDNDYIRALRKHIDDYKSGKVKDKNLDMYKEDIQGKFIIGHTDPFLLGGLFIEFIFVDKPEKIFSVWVYSDVDEQKKKVVGYSVRSIGLEQEESGFTSKQQIMDLLKEHPEYKLW